ncbi:hypothetical protein SASPL_153678 [Salvia splendens]|uniref:Pectinesterase n=1 Tax=Salvia splendens TaxID=180675 RepID=A0A8X8VYS4_SALSN|nr:pectinesterase-like [Salvia splendens]KAG6384859.1 hypothetical protein SASPL_153678 [Salvia splendens]
MENMQPENHSKNKRKIVIFSAFLSLLVVATVSIPFANHHTSDAGRLLRSACAAVLYPELCLSTSFVTPAVVRSTCAATLYPELCLTTLDAAAPGAAAAKTSRDVLITSMNSTISTAGGNLITVQKAERRLRQSLTARQKAALCDCLQMADATLEVLRLAEAELVGFGSEGYSLDAHKDNLLTYLSAAQTNQDTCLDGADEQVRDLLVAGHKHVFRLASNVMAIIKNLSDAADEAAPRLKSRAREEWPEWLSEGDRLLLQATAVNADVTVAADGSGNYRTVAEAVAAAPAGSSQRYVIAIKAGVYRENVKIDKNKKNLMFVGDGRLTTIITASKNYIDDGSTYNSATVAVEGCGFLARDITFQNAAGPYKEQAVALRVSADFTAFYACSMLAYQDTLYVHSLRQFYTQCVIVGTVDFIFGNAAVVLQNCDIKPRVPKPGQQNMVTAQGRTDPNQNTGIVIQKSTITANNDLEPVQDSYPTYLGRPWQQYSRTVVMQNQISDVIVPAGWHPWNDSDFALNTLFYAEYKNTGKGAATGGRVKWKGFHVLTRDDEAQPFTAGEFINDGDWLQGTGFPVSLGL